MASVCPKTGENIKCSKCGTVTDNVFAKVDKFREWCRTVKCQHFPLTKCQCILRASVKLKALQQHHRSCAKQHRERKALGEHDDVAPSLNMAIKQEANNEPTRKKLSDVTSYKFYKT
jgi:hypothetical protein